jgi:ABC-type antimicrobial peptide transport system permease subunit
MAAVWMRFRAEMRAHWRQVIGVALLAGIAGAAVITAFAGARRTNTTLARAEREERVSDLLVNPDGSDDSAAFASAWSRVDTLPGVKRVGAVDGIVEAPLDASGRPHLDVAQSELSIAATDGAYGRDVDRPHVLAGRLPDPSRDDEVLINETEARRQHLTLGSRLHLGVFAVQDLYSRRDPTGAKPRFVEDFRVVGIGTNLDDASRSSDDPNLSVTTLFTPALERKLDGAGPPFIAKSVVLADGAKGVPAFEAQVRDLFKNVQYRAFDGTVHHANMNFQETSLTTARVHKVLRPYVLALWLFGALAAIASLAVLAQALSRSVRPLREERERLRAIGFSRRQLLGTAALRGLAVGVLGAVLAVVLALLLSPLMPIGPLRSIDPSRGVHVDGAVFALAVLAMVALAVGGTALAIGRRKPPRPGFTAVGDELARAGVAVPLVSGVRFAFDRGRDADVPLRSTLIGITVAVAALAATLVYGAGLTRFTGTPRRYGWPWTYQLGVNDGAGDAAAVAQRLAASPGKYAATAGLYSQFDIDGRSVAAVGIDAAPGVSFLPVLSGRAPTGDDEIVLGEATLRSLHKRVGDTINVFAQTKSRPMRIVGTAVFPRFAPYSGSEPTGLGIGAATNRHAIFSMNAQLGSQFVLVQLPPGSKTTSAELVRAAGIDQDGNPVVQTVVGPQRPNDVLSYDHLSTTPLVLAAVLALLALGSAIHLLVTGVRGRRRDIALLKTVGFTRAQARTAVQVQATVLVALALLVALPLGLLAGRWLWTLTAHWLGIAGDAPIPGIALALVAIGAVVIANVVAVGPAVIAARIRPAVALRSE